VVKIADVLDMEQSRAHIPFEIGKMNIHSVSAMSIEQVEINSGKEKPTSIHIKMSNPAGIFRVDNLLGAKIRGSGLEEHIQVEVLMKEGNKQNKINFEP